MKKYYQYIAFTALVALIALPAVSQAEDGNVSIDTDTSVHADASVDISNPIPPPPPGQGQNPQNNTGPGSGSIRDRIRADYQARLENVKNNQDSRNIMMAARMGSSTSHEDNQGDDDRDSEATNSPRLRFGMPRGPRSLASSTMMGSTTMRGGFKIQYEDNGRAMRLGSFEIRKAIVTKELDVAIGNLNNISSRLNSRIQKETAAGHDMSAATDALATAASKIKIASDAVTALETYLPDATSTVTASTTVNLDTARSMTATAKDAIKDAQRSLNDVVTAIAHALGIELTSNTSTSASSTVSQ